MVGILRGVWFCGVFWWSVCDIFSFPWASSSFYFLYLGLTGWQFTVSLKLARFLFILLKSFSIGWISIFGAWLWLFFFNKLSHFYIVSTSEVKVCCSKFLLNSGYCVLAVTSGSAMDCSQMWERFYGMNRTTETLQVGKEVDRCKIQYISIS